MDTVVPLAHHRRESHLQFIRAIRLAAPLLCVAAAARLCAGPAEDAFAATWRQQEAAPTPAAAAAVCSRAPGSAGVYAAVLRTQAGLRLLAAGRSAEAAAALEAAVPSDDDPVRRAAADLARRWLTRMDRERVRAALRAWYAAHVAYPPELGTLATLVPQPRLPPSDRWGESWVYRLAPLRALKGLPDQRYVLESRSLGADSDLAAALAAPFAGAAALRVARVVSRQPVAAEIEIVRAARTNRTTFAEGAATDGVRLVRLADPFALLTDGDRWQVVWPPGPRP